MAATKVDVIEHVMQLINKSAAAHDSAEALRFAQAASNAAGAICTIKNLPKESE